MSYVLGPWKYFNFKHNHLWLRSQIQKETISKCYRASIKIVNCIYYEWNVQFAPNENYVAYKVLKKGTCKTFERAKANCDFYLKKKLKIKLLNNKFIIML